MKFINVSMIRDMIRLIRLTGARRSKIVMLRVDALRHADNAGKVYPVEQSKELEAGAIFAVIEDHKYFLLYSIYIKIYIFYS